MGYGQTKRMWGFVTGERQFFTKEEKNLIKKHKNLLANLKQKKREIKEYEDSRFELIMELEHNLILVRNTRKRILNVDKKISKLNYLAEIDKVEIDKILQKAGGDLTHG
jgi:hypothetical protein